MEVWAVFDKRGTVKCTFLHLPYRVGVFFNTSPVTKCLDKIQAPNRIKISVFIQKRKKSHVNVQEFTTNFKRD